MVNIDIADDLAIQQEEEIVHDLSPAEAEAMQDAEFGGASEFVPFIPDETIIRELPDDAPGDDRVDRGLMSRANEIENQLALEWLLKSTENEQPEQPSLLQRAGSTALSVAKDIGQGGLEAPSQIAGGARDAAQAALNGIDALGDWMAGIFNEEEGKRLSAERNVPELPEIREPKSVTGGIIRGIAQFLTGYASAGAFIKGGGIAAAAAKGAASDFAFFEGQESNLSNLIQANPQLSNPINEFLASDPNDNEAENRLKRALEGVGVGAATYAFSMALKSLRAARGAKGAKKGFAKLKASAARHLDPEVQPARSLDLLGTEDAPLTAKMAQATKETVTGVPDDVAAKSLTKGLTPLGDGDVYVNWARIDGPEDVKRVIQDVSSAMRGSVDDARRGVRTHAATKASADDIDAFDIILNRRQGQPLNAEESVAVRALWIGAADKLQDVAQTAATAPSPENLFQFRKMLATFHAIQKEAIGARTETARALNAWKIPVGGDRQRMAAMEAAMNNFGGTEVSLDMARKIAALDDKMVLGEFVEKSLYAKTRDAVQEYWINSILSGPQTHMVNMMSNSYVAALNLVEHGIAARIGRFMGGENVVEVGEALARSYGVVSGFRDALRNAGKSFRTGQTGYGVNKLEGARTRAISSTAWNLRSNSWHGRAVDGLGAVVNTPGRFLGAEDEFFKTIGYRMSLHGQAYRQVQREIREGALEKAAAKARLAELISNPTEDMSLEAAAAAAYQTFTDEPGPFVRWVMQGRHKVPALKFVVPFVNTPANILKFTFERTPLAPLSATFRAAIAKGGADADLALTKMGLGTMTMMVALDMALNGQLTGSGPEKFSEKSNLRRQGWQPNSVRIGDKFFAYNRLDPLGAQLGLAAELGEYLVNSGEMDNEEVENFTRAFAATVFAVAETATSKTYLTGLSDLIAAVNEPGRFSTSYVKRFAGGFIPNIVRQGVRAFDPVPRYTVGVVDELKARLPGFADELPPRRDLWGREIRWESGIGRPYDVISPIYGSTYKPEPIDLEMEKDGWYLGAPGKAFKYNKQDIRLRDRPDAYSRLLELQGTMKPSAMPSGFGAELIEEYGDLSQLDLLNQIVEGAHPLSEEYRNLPDAEEREKFIRKINGRFRRSAKEVIMQEFPDLLQ